MIEPGKPSLAPAPIWVRPIALSASILFGAVAEALPQSILIATASSFLTTDRAVDVQVVGKYAYVANWGRLSILDVSDPAHPKLTGQYRASAGAFWAWGVQVVDNYAYVADHVTGLHIVDISVPSNPTQVGFYASDQATVFTVRVFGGLAYLIRSVDDGTTGSEHGILEVINVSDPTSPRLVGQYRSRELFADVQVVGNYAYLAERANELDRGALQVLDLSNPAQPAPLGRFEIGWWANAVQVVGNVAYVASGYAGLQLIDVTNPAKLVAVASYPSDSFGYSSDVKVLGNLAFTANGWGGLRVLDLSKSPEESIVGDFDSGGQAGGLQVLNNYIYVANGDAGVGIFRWGWTQMFDFDLPTCARTNAGPLTLTATSNSGLPVSLSLLSGPASLVGNTLTATGLGKVTIRAEQAGNDSFFGAVVDRSVTFLDNTAVFLAISVHRNGATFITVYSPIDTPFTLQTASSLGTSIRWTDLVSTNPPILPFVFADEGMQTSARFYRVLHP